MQIRSGSKALQPRLLLCRNSLSAPTGGITGQQVTQAGAGHTRGRTCQLRRASDGSASTECAPFSKMQQRLQRAEVIAFSSASNAPHSEKTAQTRPHGA